MGEALAFLRVDNSFHDSFELWAKSTSHRIVREIVGHQVLASLAEPVSLW